MSTDVVAEQLHEFFCANVLRLRKLRGMTQAQLAERLGVSRPYVAEVEAGRHSPGLDLVARIAEALETTGKALLSEPKTISKNAS